MDCPGGPVIKKPPANAGDRSSIPGLGRFHMTCYSATKPKHNYCTEPTPPRTRALQQRGLRDDKPEHHKQE